MTLTIRQHSNPLPIIFKPLLVNDKAREYFHIIKEKLLTAKDIRVEIEDDNCKVTFFHSLREINILLKINKLQSYFQNNLSTTRPFINVSFRGLDKFQVQNETYLLFKEREKELINNAEEFINHRLAKPVQLMVPEKGNLIEYLFLHHAGICIGELKGDLSARRFVIQNLDKFVFEGATTLYLENFLFDSTQLWLNKYKISPYLHEYLIELDKKVEIEEQKYSYVSLIKKAKSLGLRIVGLDTTVSYQCGYEDKGRIQNKKLRAKVMNIVSTQIIEATKGNNLNKFIALMNYKRLSEFKGIPGIADLLHCPSIAIEESDLESIQYNVTDFHSKISMVSMHWKQVYKKK